MSDTNHIEHYRNQISLARTEIKNLRQQIASLKHEHQKEVQLIKSNLDALRCANCVETATTCVASNSVQASSSSGAGDGCINFKPIGVIETTFQNKRGVPRQPTGLNNMPGTVVIDPGVFNNPEHALSGLEEFSHMWILFHFHETNSQRVQAKVSPPRLLGERRGVFTTRSPHRPCPIGLSLVKIQSCEGNKIHFTGVDMINGTPVLDVKPYIVQYDYPAHAYDEYMQDRPPTEGFSQAISGIDNLTLRDGAGDAEVGRVSETNSDGVDTT